jgi:hypothetical protein
MSENPADNDFHAFPTSSVDGFTQHGMMLRDWFAGQAMASVIAVVHNAGGWSSDDDDYEKAIAEGCYAIADHMLAARSHAPALWKPENKQEREA